MRRKKMTIYLSEDLVQETRKEALRHDRSLSWVLEMAWRLSGDKIKEMPAIHDLASESKAAL